MLTPLWDQVAGQAVFLLRMHVVALKNTDAITEEISAKSIGKRLDGSTASGAGLQWRLELTRTKVLKLAYTAVAASTVDNFTRVTNPFEMPKLYDALTEIQRRLTVFTEGYGMRATAAFERKA